MSPTLSREHSLSETTVEGLRGDIRLLELNRRLNWFMLLRLAVAGVFLVGAVLVRILFKELRVSPVPLLLMSAALATMNGVFWWHYRRLALARLEFERYRRAISLNLHGQILVDFAIITWLLYVTAGVGSPVTYFFLFHVTLSCLFFRRRLSFIYVLLAIGLILAVQFLVDDAQGRAEVIARSVPWCEGPSCTYYYTASVVVVYLFVWYLAATITNSLRHSEAELQANIEELVEMHREKTRYMLTTTHELKAPFSSIHSYINVLLAGYVGPIDPKVGAILEKIRERCNRLLNMINELLQLANIKKLVQQGTDLEPVDLSPLIDKVLQALEPIRKAREVTIDKTGMGRGAFWVKGDSERLEILFTNIIGNAIHYSHDGGTVELAFNDGERFRRVTVTDHGIGIRAEHLEKVFLEHFRTEEAVARNANSTGLGLTISKFIIYMHQGRIWLQSEHGKGTRVYMEFLKASSR
jgi:signal transduction histidine kinase